MPHFQGGIDTNATSKLPDGFVIKGIDNVGSFPSIARLDAMGWGDFVMPTETMSAAEFFSDAVQAQQAELRRQWLESLPERGDSLTGNVRTVLRHWYDPGQVFGGTYEENKQRARVFFSTFIDGTFRQYADRVDFVEEFNEYLASSHTGQELQDRLTWAKAVADVWKNEYRTQSELAHIRLVLVNAPVGNDIANGFAQIAVQYDCVMGFHNYDHWINGVRDPGSWQYYAGRFVTLDNNFKAAGYTVDWMFTETGPFSSAIDGWKHPNVCGGDIEKYVDTVEWFIGKLKTTDAWATGRILGAHWFTTNGGSQWKNFETSGNDLIRICQTIGAEWQGQGTPDPPPDPPPPDPPPAGNLLRNADFELGWYDIATGQVPNEWSFEYYTGSNPYDPSPYVKPETRVIPKSGPGSIPLEDWILFGLGDFQAIKAFKGSGCWHGAYIQNLTSSLTKPGKLTVRFFADLVASYSPKVYANYDPDNPAGQMRVNGGAWYLMRPGEINEAVFDLPAGTSQIKVESRYNYPMASMGIFGDDWKLTEVETMPDRTWKKKVYLLDPGATPAQYTALQAIAYPTKSEIAFSADSAFDRPPGVTERHEVIVYGWGGSDNLEPWIEQYYKFSPATIRSYKPLTELSPF